MRRFSLGFFLLILVFSFINAQDYYPPEDLEAISNLDSHIPLSWSVPVIPRELVELFYDDGFARSTDSAEAYDIMSVRFTAVEPCTLKTAKFFLYCTAGAHPVRIRVWGDDGAGRPQFSAPLCPAIDMDVDIASDWLEVDVTPYDLIFYPGEEFHISIEKRDTFYFPFYFLLADESPVTPQRSFIYDFTYFASLAVDGDWMIRALVAPFEDRRVFRSTTGRRIHHFDEQVREYYELQPVPEEFGDIPRQYAVQDVRWYNIYRSEVPGDPEDFDYIAFTEELTYDDWDVTNDMTYYYYVTAVYLGGESEPTEIVSATPRSGAASLYVDTLRYISCDSAIAAVSWRPGAKVGNVFSVEGPCKLSELHYRFYHTGRFYPEVYEWDGDGVGDPIFVYPFARDVLAAGWIVENVRPLRIILNDDFFVSCRYADGSLSLSLMDMVGADWSWDFDPTEGWRNVTDTSYCIRAVVEYNDAEQYLVLNEGWNMLSFTVIPETDDMEELFPFLLVPSVYYWDPYLRSYVYDPTVVPGRGYFVFSLVDTTVLITGTPITSFDYECWEGWDLIGSLSSYLPVPLSAAVTYPADAIEIPNTFYWDPNTRSYVMDTFFYPGLAHWVLFVPDCVFRLSIE
ncbi:hypothetical protein JXI42_03295 [bacterium]|nr:hypothetical protein [bacterium]